MKVIFGRMQMANRKHDVIAVLITDPRELELPPVWTRRPARPRDGRRCRSAIPARGPFATRIASSGRAIEQLEHRFRRAKIDFIHIDSAGSIVDPLARFFRMREKRRMR